MAKDDSYRMMAAPNGQFGMTRGNGEQEQIQGQTMAIKLICTKSLDGVSEPVVVLVLSTIGLLLKV